MLSCSHDLAVLLIWRIAIFVSIHCGFRGITEAGWPRDDLMNCFGHLADLAPKFGHLGLPGLQNLWTDWACWINIGAHMSSPVLCTLLYLCRNDGGADRQCAFGLTLGVVKLHQSADVKSINLGFLALGQWGNGNPRADAHQMDSGG